MKVAACVAALVLAVTAGCTSDDADGGSTSTTPVASATAVNGPTLRLMARLRCTKPAALPATTVGAMPASDVGCSSPAGPLEIVTFKSADELDKFLVALRKYLRTNETVVLVKGTTWVVSYKAPDNTDLARGAVTARYRAAAKAARSAVGGEIVTLRG